MRLSELLASQPRVEHVHNARANNRNALIASGKRLVVIDDDPTGMQTVQDVKVYMDWSVNTLRKAIASRDPVFFVSVNSRSLSPEKAKDLALEVGKNLRQAVQMQKAEILLASRSDSTLRGHFPYEVDALLEGYGLKPDGMIFAPAFFEAGRYTVDDVHWAEQSGEIVPVDQTEFSRDPMFNYRNGNLKAWIEEKTKGDVKEADILSISLKQLRQQGPEAVSAELLLASNGRPVIVNGAGYEDYDSLCSGIQAAEEKGKVFVYRCSASFIKARGGFKDRALLTQKEMAPLPGPGLIIAGSYVDKTTRQLQHLIQSGLAESIELRTDVIEFEGTGENEVQQVSREIERKLAAGKTVAVYTSRKLHVTEGRAFSESAEQIMKLLCEVVSWIDTCPGYIIAKGGATSIEIAKKALGARETLALGQILPGVPVWRLGPEARWPGIPYVVFPGNVGDDTALLRAVRTLCGG
jgi:uncharacterized protein YgbK (DUF1537 family)